LQEEGLRSLKETFQSLIGFGRQKNAVARPRIEIPLGNTVVYAVGDVHGCFGELLSLERKIVADGAQFAERKLIIMLGDYIDRGPDSARVVEHLLASPPDGFQRICLAGNHETALIDYLEGRLTRDLWLAGGGASTLRSYGLDLAYLTNLYSSTDVDQVVRNSIPAEHVEFLRSLPVIAYSRQIAFVHAGIRPGVPIEKQDENDLLYIRGDFFDGTDQLDRWVIHGHTPVKDPSLQGRRLNIDTGAYMSGRLTAVRLGTKGARFLFS